MSDFNLDETRPVKTEPAGKSDGNNPPVDPAAATQRVKLPGVERTQPVQTKQPASPTPPFVPPAAGDRPVMESGPAPRKKPLRWLIVVFGLLLTVGLGALGGFLGYRSAQAAKEAAYAKSVTELATEQFMLGLQAQNEGRYELAIQHFEYVIQVDPNFPGAGDKLAEVMLAVAVAKTPTPEIILPTITPSPTPDFRGEEEIFNNAKALMANKEWVQTLQVLDTLRDKNLNYRAVEVDGMYYVALRNRGLIKVNNGELEGGLYDLALVERFGPLDVDAMGVRTWARLYLSGSRFWGVRWDKVVEAFAEIYPYFPNMHDNSGFTATERFRIASLRYGDQLSAAGQFCEALQQYQNAQGITNDAAVEPTVTAVYNGCFPPTPTLGPTLTPTPTFTITVGPSETPTPTTEAASPTPTNTSEAPAETPPSAETPPA